MNNDKENNKYQQTNINQVGSMNIFHMQPFETKDDEINALKAILYQKDKEITKIERAFEEKDQLVEALKQTIQVQADFINHLKKG